MVVRSQEPHLKEIKEPFLALSSEIGESLLSNDDNGPFRKRVREAAGYPGLNSSAVPSLREKLCQPRSTLKLPYSRHQAVELP